MSWNFGKIVLLIIGLMLLALFYGAEPGNVLKPLGIDPPHLYLGGSNSCSFCHVDYNNKPEPLTEDWISFTVCKSCHSNSGSATPAEVHIVPGDTIWCETCHNPHHHQDIWPHKYINSTIQRPDGSARDVAFADSLDFVHGAPDYDGICEVCHTLTSYHRNNSSGDHSHNVGTDCMSCHPHTGGFQSSCTDCHGTAGVNAAPPIDIFGLSDSYEVGKHQQHLQVSINNTGSSCDLCHYERGPGTGLHGNGGGQAYVNFHPAAGPGATWIDGVRGISPGSCSNIACHEDADWDPNAAGGCTMCHGSPPESGAHPIHFDGDVSQASYGGTENFSNDTAYVFQCGNCHPNSISMHQNGTVDVELYNPGAPGGSLKSLNPDSASYIPGGTTYTDVDGIDYTLGTCSNVYCHSSTDWSSPDPISNPLLDPVNGWALLDSNGNLTYEPYVVTELKVYPSISWGDASLDCNGCHRNNPQTSYPEVQAGVGNTHAWISDWGYEDLHAWNMSFDPLICRICHYNTVTDTMTSTRDASDITYFDDVPIANKAYHVNGIKDVAFDPINSVTYNSTYSVAGITYNPETKVCASVPCHLNQENPEWGKPYRTGWGSLECDQCHRYGGPWPPASIKKVSPNEISLSEHESYAGTNCTVCHENHGGK
jgi:Geobacter CxxxxCH...CXXCH motif (GSu_C4xC__C2xCH)